MRRRALVAVAAVVAVLVMAGPAWAGSPHFTAGQPTVSRTGDDLTVAGKVAGLGNETQITVTLTADVQCVNPGNSEPQAENKQAVIATGVFPVQNGKAVFTLTGKGTTSPACNPPMTLVYSNVTVTVSGASFATFSFTFPGSF